MNSLKRGLRMAIDQLTDSQRPTPEESSGSVPELNETEAMKSAREASRPMTVS
jgi:hypothetical protein